VKETTAQDASGSTIALSADLTVVLFFSAGETERSRGRPRIGIGIWSNDPEPCPDEEAVDAAGPVDAQNAPTGPWKTADGFPRAPTAIIGSLTREESPGRHHTRPPTGRGQQPSAAGGGRHSFADPSPAEIVVVNRQK
jgi:hypothetical protein